MKDSTLTHDARRSWIAGVLADVLLDNKALLPLNFNFEIRLESEELLEVSEVKKALAYAFEKKYLTFEELSRYGEFKEKFSSVENVQELLAQDRLKLDVVSIALSLQLTPSFTLKVK